jgi:tRNA (cytosine34-C5)-methyltransferase
MKQKKQPASSATKSIKGGGGDGDEKKGGEKRWRGGGGGGLTTMRSDGVIVPGGSSNKKQKVTNTKRALREAQLDKSQLLMWRKFGYGEQLFAQYYRKQNLMDPSELAVLQATFAMPLPITFRLHATDPRAGAFAARLHALAARPNPLVKLLPWMPAGEGWQAVLADAVGAGGGKEREEGGAADNSHTYIGRREKLHEEVAEVVKEGTAAGLLARQEAVSMLPVLVLAPALPLQPGSRVLDVCAAPGNKTMQLLERCAPPPPSLEGAAGAGAAGAASGGGLVVANDAHPGGAVQVECSFDPELESAWFQSLHL